MFTAEARRRRENIRRVVPTLEIEHVSVGAALAANYWQYRKLFVAKATPT
jgi:hypothetical protein